jgi:hypothetical protein
MRWNDTSSKLPMSRMPVISKRPRRTLTRERPCVMTALGCHSIVVLLT